MLLFELVYVILPLRLLLLCDFEAYDEYECNGDLKLQDDLNINKLYYIINYIFLIIYGILAIIVAS